MEKNNSCRSSYNSNNFQNSKFSSSRFCSSSISSRFSSASRSSSPTRISIRNGNMTPTSRVRFSLDHGHKSPGSSAARNISDRTNNNSNNNNNSNSNKLWGQGSRKTCLCSPTTHPGSFRCSLHKNSNNGNRNNTNGGNENRLSYRSHGLYARRSAMTNSLVRIGTVEGDLVKRALASLIRPSSHQQRRRNDFQRRPSRLSMMSKAEE